MTPELVLREYTFLITPRTRIQYSNPYPEVNLPAIVLTPWPSVVVIDLPNVNSLLNSFSRLDTIPLRSTYEPIHRYSFLAIPFRKLTLLGLSYINVHLYIQYSTHIDYCRSVQRQRNSPFFNFSPLEYKSSITFLTLIKLPNLNLLNSKKCWDANDCCAVYQTISSWPSPATNR